MDLMRGTVTQASPLRVRLDGSQSDALAEHVGDTPVLGERVRVLADDDLLLAFTSEYDQADVDAMDLGKSALFTDPPSAFPSRASVRYVGNSAAEQVQAPTAGVTWTLLTVKRSTTTVWQIAMHRSSAITTNNLWYRNGYEGAGTNGWGSWRRLATTDDLDARPQRITIPAGALAVRGTFTKDHYLGSWVGGVALADGASSYAGATLILPDDWASFHVDVVWVGSTATAGNVRMRSVHDTTAPTAAFTANGGTYYVLPNPGTTNPRRDRLLESYPVSAGDIVNVGVDRVGADATDTYTGSMVVLALIVTRAS